MIANLLSLILTVPFPLFATYKALKAPTIDALAPLLTFYTVLSLLFFLESTILLPFTYLPLYSWVRLGVHAYLCLPPPQGAVLVYNTYIQPFLTKHETAIEDFVSKTHHSAKAAGLQYIKQAVDWTRVNIFGKEPRPPTPPPSYGSYAQQLLSRFYSTSPTGTHPGSGAVPSRNDVYSAISSILQTASLASPTSSPAAHAKSLTESGTLIPENISNPADRLKYIRQAQESLKTLMQAFAREEGNIARQGAASLGSGLSMSKSRSETDFDKIDRSEASHDAGQGGVVPPAARRMNSSGGWMPWNWGGKGQYDGSEKKDEGPVEDVPAQGKSSGVDL